MSDREAAAMGIDLTGLSDAVSSVAQSASAFASSFARYYLLDLRMQITLQNPAQRHKSVSTMSFATSCCKSLETEMMRHCQTEPKGA